MEYENKNNHILFDLIKEHKWNEFFDYLNNTKEIVDVNIRDNSNNYLIQYALLYNKKNIIELLITKGAKLDILDVDGRTILFIPIKYNYHDVLDTIIKFDKDNVGVSLTEIKDKNGHAPIHYAVLFNNYNALTLILQYQTNINIQDRLGNSALHSAIMIKNTSMVELLLKYKPNINLRTKTGDTPLHLACNFEQYQIAKMIIDLHPDVNLTDYENELTPLIYSVSLNRLDFVKLLLTHGADPNIQDQFGNSSLHYCVYDNHSELFDYIVNNSNVNFNNTNINGQTPLHIVLDTTLLSDSNKLFYIDKSISKTNLNIQDNNGNTCLFLIVKNNYWKRYISQLSCKKLDIYKSDKQGIKVIDMINPSDKDLFIQMIINGFYCVIKNKKPDNIFVKWQRECSTQILDEHKCKALIKKQILEEYISVPDIQKYNIVIAPGDLIKFGTFTGLTLDVLCGLIYLMKKWQGYINSTLSTNFVHNKELFAYYKSLGTGQLIEHEFINFEIVWIHKKLYFPTVFVEKINDFLTKLKTNKKLRFFIAPLGIEFDNESHANYIIYDSISNELERFEPHGSRAPTKLNYDPQLLDSTLKHKLSEIIPNIKIIQPTDYLPRIGYQLLDSSEKNQYKNIGDPGGFCAIWSIWYTDMRLTYPDIPRKKLIDLSIDYIRSKGYSFRTLIRNYSAKIIEIRDVVLDEVGIDINAWINDNYSENQLSKLCDILIAVIKKIELK